MKKYNLKINGNDYEVAIEVKGDNEAEVVVNGAAFAVEVSDTASKPPVVKSPQVAAVPASHAVQTPVAPVKAPSPAAAGEMPVRSPLPGVILDLKVREGDTVTAGQTIVVLEAMKMENNIDADRGGVVQSIRVKSGDSVLEGDVLLTIK